MIEMTEKDRVSGDFNDLLIVSAIQSVVILNSSANIDWKKTPPHHPFIAYVITDSTTRGHHRGACYFRWKEREEEEGWMQQWWSIGSTRAWVGSLEAEPQPEESCNWPGNQIFPV